MSDPLSAAAIAALAVSMLAQLGVRLPDVRLRALAAEAMREEDDEETVQMRAVESAH